MFGKIKITDFAKRQFESKSGGTKILDKTPEEFESTLNQIIHLMENPDSTMLIPVVEAIQKGTWNNRKIIEGYAPFCKLIAIPNFTNAKVGSMPIDISNYQYLRHGYSARTEKELPVMTRWFELPLSSPIADYLIVIVYSKEQIEKEHIESNKESLDSDFKFDADWGVVAILGQSHPNEEPMQPITMMRNALGTKEGGSGVSIDREKYLASVEFWKNNAIIKS